MTRHYANLATSVWREFDWRGLTASEQRTYSMLMSQPDISAAGVLSVTLGRWAGYARDTTISSIRADIDGLAAARFVIVDDESEEILVRTFVKWDGGYGNPKRRPVILRAANEVMSPSLRAALAVEFTRLGLPIDDLTPPTPTPPDRPSGRQADSLFDSPDLSASRDKPNWDQATRAIGYAQVNSLSSSHTDTHADSDTPSDGVVVTKGLYVVPQPSTHNPQTPPAALGPASPDATLTQRSKRITDAYATVQPLSKWPAVNAIVLRAIKTERWSDEQIHAAMQRLAADERSVTVDTLRIELTGPPARRPSPIRGAFDPNAAMDRALAREAAVQ